MKFDLSLQTINFTSLKAAVLFFKFTSGGRKPSSVPKSGEVCSRSAFICGLKVVVFCRSVIEIIEDALDLNSEKYIPGKKVYLCPDPQDNFLLELAQESRADYLISTDLLVLEIKQYKSTKIITPREFLRILQR